MKVGTLITAAAALHATAPVTPAHAASAWLAAGVRRSAVAEAPAPDAARGAVTAVRVAPAGTAGAEIAVRVDRQVEVQDFTLDSPFRIVLDISGAQLAHAARAYDGVVRGGVTNVRLSQFRAGIVRVVVELDGSHRYEVRKTDGEVRLVVKGGATDFAPWQSAGIASVVAAQPAPQAAPPAAEQPAEQPPVARPAPAPTRLAVRQPEKIADKPVEKPAERPAIAKAAVDKPAFEKARDSEPEPTRAEPASRVAVAPRITVTYQDADIHDVVAAFAAFSGRTIIVGRDVTGQVTAEIKEQPWDVALGALLRSQGLAATEDKSGIITVDSYKNIASTRAVEPLVTQIVEVNYAKASSLLPIVQTLLSRDCGTTVGNDVVGAASGATANSAAATQAGASTATRTCLVRGAVTADTSTNKLLVTDVPSHLPEITARLQELDVRTPQVAIKAKIVFVNRTGLEDIGVSYDLGTGTQQFFNSLVKRIDPSTRKPVDTNGDGVPDAMGGGSPFDGDRISVGGNALSALANANNAMTPSALNLIYSATIGRFQLTSFLNVLQQTSLADVQSEPSIVTLNNRTAEIFVGQQIPIRVIDASAGGNSGGGGGGNFPRATVRLEEAGIKLSVTPQVTNNRKVVLTVSAENSNAQAASSDVGVIFNRQRADNQLLVGDGETAVIGGLTVTETSKAKTGIPFLVDLPLIGRLFGQTTTSQVKRDLLILITPHILEDGETAPTNRR
ncbi:type II and III secretion system protein [Gemmatirosa kalamazoonensis]|uniref:Type II and III secretion system protein n=1 Tax=Gemmatirosa kalamazoonensis TaxID=861299 RepID=W0RPS7_9BACT|nr:type IV pilus secretin family protein [Gemmatirosa kalamazoonensis]AHG91513.1 type II and III secretion system protein [Gemmatirosa kalamazoonensis]